MQRDSTGLHGDGNLDLIGTLRILRHGSPFPPYLQACHMASSSEETSS
jgi:hypothetical protein